MAQVNIKLNLDDDLIADYLGGFEEALESVEKDIRLLAEGGDCQELYDDMLRHLHSIKGNARMCELALPERLAHVIESAVIAVKEAGLQYFPDLGETIQVALEKVRESSNDFFHKRVTDETKFQQLIEILEQFAVNVDQAVVLTNRFLHLTTNAPLHEEVEASKKGKGDLQLIQAIGSRCIKQGEKYTGRIERIKALALEINQLAEYPADPVQLEAAIYLSDLDVESQKTGVVVQRFNIDANNVSSQLILTYLQGWPEAISILDQDPNTAGAAILRLVRHYDDMTFPKAGRNVKQEILKTLAEMGQQHENYGQQWVQLLSEAVRNIMLRQA